MVRAIVDVELAAALGGLDVATAVAKKWDKAYREGGPQVFKEGKSHLELLSRLPPWRHGDTVTMTPEAVHARARLRVHPAIVTELQRWWVTATYSTGKDKLDRTGYVCVSRLLAKTMTENYEPNLAQASAEIDFEADAGATDGNGDGNSASGASGSEPTISRREYMDFLFQLTDVCALPAIPPRATRSPTASIASALAMGRSPADMLPPLLLLRTLPQGACEPQAAPTHAHAHMHIVTHICRERADLKHAPGL